ncbi:uncharacterized protein [Argopecten irradians]|uniref:uncharacterized protein n=1 Tax=Argopecten irradians TaxID=31199 RepID=UPI00371A7F5C
MGCIQSKSVRKRKKKSAHQINGYPEQNETKIENSGKFSQWSTKNKTSGNGVKEMLSGNRMQSTFTTAQANMNGIVAKLPNKKLQDVETIKQESFCRRRVLEINDRKPKLVAHHRKLFTVLLLAMLTFLHYMRMQVVGIRVLVSRDDIAYYLLLRY